MTVHLWLGLVVHIMHQGGYWLKWRGLNDLARLCFSGCPRNRLRWTTSCVYMCEVIVHSSIHLFVVHSLSKTLGQYWVESSVGKYVCLFQLAGYPLRGKSSVCVMFLKYRIIMSIIRPIYHERLIFFSVCRIVVGSPPCYWCTYSVFIHCALYEILQRDVFVNMKAHAGR